MSITLIIVAITCGLTFYAWNKPDLAFKWMFTPYRIKQNNEYYRFLTHGIIHSFQLPNGYFHLGFNMFALYTFGENVEWLLKAFHGEAGIFIYVAIYVAALIVSSIPSYFKYKNDPGYNALGASGAVSAIVFFLIMFFPTSTVYVFVFPMPGFIIGILYIGYSYYMANKNADKVGHEAHLFGALFGIVCAFLVYPNVLSEFFLYGEYGVLSSSWF